MGVHVLVVDKFSFPVHRSRGFCGVKNPPSRGVLYGLYADLKEIRIGDLVLFFQFRVDEAPEDRGFRSVYKVTSKPSFDDTNIDWQDNLVLDTCPRCNSTYSEKKGICRNCRTELPEGQHILPYRLLIEPLTYYDRPVDDNNIELKDGAIDAAAVDQANRYAKWVAQLTTANVDPPVR